MTRLAELFFQYSVNAHSELYSLELYNHTTQQRRRQRVRLNFWNITKFHTFAKGRLSELLIESSIGQSKHVLVKHHDRGAD